MGIPSLLIECVLSIDDLTCNNRTWKKCYMHTLEVSVVSSVYIHTYIHIYIKPLEKPVEEMIPETVLEAFQSAGAAVLFRPLWKCM